MRKINKMMAVILILGGLNSFTGCSKTEEATMEMNKPDGITELETQISETYGDAGGIVTIISDDGFYQTAVNLNEIFGKRGLRCTVAGAIYIVEPDLDLWKSLLEEGNIDIVSHSYNHIRMEEGSEIAQDTASLKHEILDADKWYEDTFGNEQIVFVCPENQMCESGYKLLEKSDFWAVRRGGRGYNPLEPEEGTDSGNWFNLMVYGVCDDGVDTTVRNGWIDTAIDDNVWLIEMWHNVMPEEDGGYQTILLTDAEEHLDYITEKSRANEIWVATFDEAVKYIRERQNAKATSYIGDDGLHIYIELTNSNMDYNTFNQPLTVHIVLPEQMSVEPTDDAEIIDGELVVNVIPGEEQIIKIFEE